MRSRAFFLSQTRPPGAASPVGAAGAETEVVKMEPAAT